KIDRKILSRKIAILFSRSAAIASSCPWLHSQGARCKLNPSKQCPYEATTSTRLNSHGSEERTQEDTMNPMRQSPPDPSPSIYELKAGICPGCRGGGCRFDNQMILLMNFQ